MQTAAPAANGKDSKFDPSTWAGQARQLARNEADASALLWGLGLLGLAVLVVAVALLLGVPAGRLVGLESVLVLIGLAMVVGLVWVYSYASALRADTQAVRMATWQRELAMGVDLDGDGSVGQPQQSVGHEVKIGGPKPAAVVLPDLQPGPDMRPLLHFPVTPNDVIFVLHRAAQVGLTFRQWDKQRLPSGFEIDKREKWTAILDGLMAWEFAEASTDAAGKRRVALRQDVSVDVMIGAVRQSVAGA